MPELKEKITSQRNLERPPILDRIVSDIISDQEKQKIVDELLDKFQKQDIEGIREEEIELSPRHKELIAEANRLVGIALKSAGVMQKTAITPSMIHLIRPDVFENYEKKKGIKAKSVAALASIEEQAVFIKAENLDELRFLDRMIHEMLHMNSFISFQAVDMAEGTKDGIGIVERRGGLRIKEIKMENGKKVAGKMLFNELDEAVIEKLTVDITRNFNIKISPEFKSDFDKSEKLRKILVEYIRDVFKEKGGQMSQGELLEVGNLYAFLNWQAILLPEAAGFLERYEKSSDTLILEQAISFYSEKTANDEIPQFAYGADRIMFERLVDSIYDKNKGEFNSARDIAALFIKASFDGRLLPLARVIESTFGKGSFRKLGEGIDITQNAGEN